MILPFARVFIALAGTASLGGAALAHQSATKQAVALAVDPAARDAVAIVDRFHDVLRAGDLNAAASLLDGDALIFESGGVERGKAEYQAHHLPADAAFSKAVPSEITARTAGSAGGFAWVATESRMSGSFKGNAVDRVSTETMLLRQSGGAWKIVHIHWSSAAAKR